MAKSLELMTSSTFREATGTRDPFTLSIAQFCALSTSSGIRFTAYEKRPGEERTKQRKHDLAFDASRCCWRLGFTSSYFSSKTPKCTR